MLTFITNDFRYSERERRDKTSENILYPIPDSRIGERVPLQPIPDKKETD